MNDLDERLLAAHAADDRETLITLYEEAADAVEFGSDACGFYLTHAFVFALEGGDPRAPRLRARLAEMGRV